jgi:hypothetical protein
VIVLPDDAVPSNRSRRDDGSGLRDVPEEYRDTVGSITWGRSVAPLRQFVEDGGTLLTIGGATAIAQRFGLPVSDALVVKDGDAERPLGRDEYYVPGSVLQVAVDNTSPLGYGLDRQVDVFFDNSPVFRVDPNGAVPRRPGAPVPRTIAWFDSATPLRSGWAWGQQHLEHAVAVVDVRLGKGHVAMFGPEITFRAQSYATFKFLFNGIFYGQAIPVTLR